MKFASLLFIKVFQIHILLKFSFISINIISNRKFNIFSKVDFKIPILFQTFRGLNLVPLVRLEPELYSISHFLTISNSIYYSVESNKKKGGRELKDSVHRNKKYFQNKYKNVCIAQTSQIHFFEIFLKSV